MYMKSLNEIYSYLITVVISTNLKGVSVALLVFSLSLNCTSWRCALLYISRQRFPVVEPRHWSESSSLEGADWLSVARWLMLICTRTGGGNVIG